MENPVLDLLSILHNLYEDEVDQDLMDYDDGERHTVAEAREVFNGKCNELIGSLEGQIKHLQKLKSELAGTSVKAFTKRHLL